MAQRGQEGREVWWGWWWWWQRKVGLVGRSRETRVGSGRDAVQQAYLSDGGKCRGPSVERGEEARVRERGKRECERRYTSTPRLFSLLLFPFPSSSSLSSLLSIWVRPVHSPACHVRHAMAKYVRRVMFYLGWGQNLSVYFILDKPNGCASERAFSRYTIHHSRRRCALSLQFLVVLRFRLA